MANETQRCGSKRTITAAWLISLASMTTPLVIAAEPSDPWQPPTNPAWTNIILQVIAGTAKNGLSPNTVAPPVAVDRTNGRLYVYGQGNSGKFLISDDLGETYSLPPQAPGQRKDSWGNIYYTPLWLSPDEGGRLAIFSSSGGVTLDGSKTWTYFSDGPGNGMEQGAVNWYDDAKTVLVTEHNGPNKSNLMLSTDRGATWKRLGKEHFSHAIGILPSGTLVSQRGKRDGGRAEAPIFRSTDGGLTWTESPAPTIGAIAPHNGVQFHYSVVNFRKKPYWVADSGVYTTLDDGATWVPVGRTFPVEFSTRSAQAPRPTTARDEQERSPVQGPMFGRDERHIVVLMTNQFIETMDGGEHWHALIPTPQPVPSTYACAFAGYDPTRDVLFFSMRHDQGAHGWVFGHIYRAELMRKLHPAKP